ncbi:CDP-archaeol synthase [Patescibacteria group bacterium]|nr:CDP-archaeol synthase [Patescibacteria group bacterium]
MLADFWQYFFSLVWLFLPAGAANMMASLSRWIDFLDCPVDFGKSLKNKRIFGNHKTWRGLFFGMIAAVLVAYLQVRFYTPDKFYYIYDYTKLNFLALGILSASGALLGDLFRCFIKRRKNIMPGTLWFPYDQIDWIAGAIITMSFYIQISWQNAIAAVALSIIIHPLINYICFLLKLQKNKF